MVDTRLVQTAVLGSAESEDPVTLPTDYRELDEFRAEFKGTTFWCGVKLSGCGRQLITKRYVDKICHFAHAVDEEQGPSTCGRGAHSADHLYVQQEFGALFRRHGHDVQGELLGEKYDDGVQFDLPHVRHLVMLKPMAPEEWKAAEAQARADGKQLSTWLVAGSDEAEDASFDADAPAMQVRLEDAGTPSRPARRPVVGTRSESGETDWDSLDDCVLNDEERIETPSLRRAGRRSPARRWQEPIAPEPESPVWTPPAPRPHARPVETRQMTRSDAEVQHAADLQHAATLAGDLRHESRSGQPNTDYVKILISEASTLHERIVAAGGESDLGNEIEHAQRRLHAYALAQARLSEADRARARSRTAAQPPSTPAANRPEAVDKVQRGYDIIRVGLATRNVLEAAARQNERLSWRKLCTLAGHREVANASNEEKYRILCVVDGSIGRTIDDADGRPIEGTTGSLPLLSALVLDSDPPKKSDAFIRIAEKHGRSIPQSSGQRSRMLHNEVDAAYAYWGTSEEPE